MIPHYLACTDYGATCGHGNTVSGLFLVLLAAGLAVAIVLREVFRKRSGR